MLISPRRVSPYNHTHIPRHGGADWIHFHLVTKAPPSRPWGSHSGDTNGLSPGAHLPERQEPLSRPPPEIRWAGNAKNQNSETLWPQLAPWDPSRPLHPQPQELHASPGRASLGYPEMLSSKEEGTGRQRKRRAGEDGENSEVPDKDNSFGHCDSPTHLPW